MILPAHTQPRPDEILSSWLVRLALCNHLPVHTFYNSVLGYHGQIWTRDIDRHPPADLITVISAATKQNASVINRLALTCYEGKLYESLPLNGDAPWLIAAGIYHRRRLRPSMQFCTKCLAEDQQSYYRKSWRTALSTICPVHCCPLMDSCPGCGLPIAFHRHGIGRSKVLIDNAGRHCSNCLIDLGDIPVNVVQFDASLVNSYFGLISILTDGDSRLLELSKGCEFLLFKGIRILVALISGRNGERLRRTLSRTTGFRLEPTRGKDFEYQTLDYRLNCMLVVTWVLEEWPHRFIELAYETKLTRSRLAEFPSAAPFWLSSVVDEKINFGAILRSDQEIDNAILYLLRSTGSVSWQALSNLTGIKRDAAKSLFSRWEKRTRG